MAKYQIKKGYEGATVCTVAPEYRAGDGRFVLSCCTQRDLRYLFEVIRHSAIELQQNEQEKPKAKGKDTDRG